MEATIKILCVKSDELLPFKLQPLKNMCLAGITYRSVKQEDNENCCIAACTGCVKKNGQFFLRA